MSTYGEMVQWLRLQLQHDREAAQRAAAVAPGNWLHNHDDAPGVIYAEDDGTELVIVDEERRPITEHFVRHDPVRVLADVEATQQQIDLCGYLLGWNADHDNQVTEHEITVMRTTAEEMLRRIALPYADRAGYLDRWRL